MLNMIQCNACGANNPDTSAFCGQCGGRLSAAVNERICPKCKNKLPEEMFFCDKCGTKWEPKAIAVQRNTIASAHSNKPKNKHKAAKIILGVALFIYIIYFIVMFANS